MINQKQMGLKCSICRFNAMADIAKPQKFVQKGDYNAGYFCLACARQQTWWNEQLEEQANQPITPIDEGTLGMFEVIRVDIDVVSE